MPIAQISMPSFELACPQCCARLTVELETAYCQACERGYTRYNGIWRFLLPSRAGRFEGFLREYRLFRAAEGWGASGASYYRALPKSTASDPQRAIWRIVAKNFARLVKLLEELKPTRILDLGAGNGWLSYQLTRRGYKVAALDLSDDARDGLGARIQYDTAFECYQAEFDRLPFGHGQFDVILFSAALHYSCNLLETLREAVRVLCTNGAIIVLATPVYTLPSSGAAMVARREKSFQTLFGLEQTNRTIGFLTERQLEQAAQETRLSVEFWHADDHWHLRARRAWIRTKNGREPARFPLIIMQKLDVSA